MGVKIITVLRPSVSGSWVLGVQESESLLECSVRLQGSSAPRPWTGTSEPRVRVREAAGLLRNSHGS